MQDVYAVWLLEGARLANIKIVHMYHADGRLGEVLSSTINFEVDLTTLKNGLACEGTQSSR